jgi:hypothetical protein
MDATAAPSVKNLQGVGGQPQSTFGDRRGVTIQTEAVMIYAADTLFDVKLSA